MVKILLDAGANPDVEGMFGTALSTAPDAESVRLMVQHGANLRPKLKVKATLLEGIAAARPPAGKSGRETGKGRTGDATASPVRRTRTPAGAAAPPTP